MTGWFEVLLTLKGQQLSGRKLRPPIVCLGAATHEELDVAVLAAKGYSRPAGTQVEEWRVTARRPSQDAALEVA